MIEVNRDVSNSYAVIKPTTECHASMTELCNHLITSGFQCIQTSFLENNESTKWCGRISTPIIPQDSSWTLITEQCQIALSEDNHLMTLFVKDGDTWLCQITHSSNIAFLKKSSFFYATIMRDLRDLHNEYEEEKAAR
jgi:hypothetical protein